MTEIKCLFADFHSQQILISFKPLIKTNSIAWSQCLPYSHISMWTLLNMSPNNLCLLFLFQFLLLIMNFVYFLFSGKWYYAWKKGNVFCKLILICFFFKINMFTLKKKTIDLIKLRSSSFIFYNRLVGWLCFQTVLKL